MVSRVRKSRKRAPSVMLRVDQDFAVALRALATANAVSVPELTRYHPRRLGQLLTARWKEGTA